MKGYCELRLVLVGVWGGGMDMAAANSSLRIVRRVPSFLPHPMESISMEIPHVMKLNGRSEIWYMARVVGT